jgi:putative flippase GtrA
MAAERLIARNPLDIPIQAVAARFGEKSKEVERFLKFALVGAFGFVVDFTTVFVLQASLLPPRPGVADWNVTIASTIGFIAAIISNFTWNRLWTYPDSRTRSLRRQLAIFAFINVIGWIIRTLWITLGHEPVGNFLMPLLLPEIQLFRPGYVPSITAAAKLGTMFCLVTGVVVVMVWNFFANRHWTYNDVE